MASRIRHETGMRVNGHAFVCRYEASQWREAGTTVQAWACDGFIDPGDADILIHQILESAIADGELVG